jgi:hypothetical protein
MDVAAAQNLLGVGVDADAPAISSAFHAAVGRLDPIDPSYQRRIDQLVDARASLLWKPEDVARAITLPPEDIWSGPRLTDM